MKFIYVPGELLEPKLVKTSLQQEIDFRRIIVFRIKYACPRNHFCVNSGLILFMVRQ